MPIIEITTITNSKHFLNALSSMINELDENHFHYKNWYNKFVLIHGYFDKQKKVDLFGISDKYKIHISNINALFKLIHVLETLYIVIIKLFIYKKITNENHIGLKNKNWFYKLNLPDFYIDDTYQYLFENSKIAKKEIEYIYKTVSLIEIPSNYDFVRFLYESLFDRRIRHSVGEYFTPDWLSEIVIKNTIGKDNILNKSFLDPTCGSGTFIRTILQMFSEPTSGDIFHNVYGIDINPISVFAAKANYLFQYFNFFQNVNKYPESLPIYEADVIHEIKYENTLFDSAKNFITSHIKNIDIIVGNPPWVNWEYLPNEYKLNTAIAWKYFSLYKGKGLDSNFLKEDISCLITYSVIHRYLKDGGKLGFLLKESIIKSIKQAKEFRNYYLVPEKKHLKILKILDFTNLKPFRGINPRTIAIIIEKNQKNNYPVKYHIIKKRTIQKHFLKMSHLII